MGTAHIVFTVLGLERSWFGRCELYASAKRAGISLAWGKGQVWEGKWKPKYLQRGKKLKNKSQPNGQACQDQEKTKPAETTRQQRRLQKMQTPSGAWEKKGLSGERDSWPMHMKSERACVIEHAGERWKQRELTHLHTNRQLTTAPEVCMGPGGMLGRLSKVQTFSKTPPEHTAVWGWPWTGLATAKKDHSRKRWNQSLLPWFSSLPLCYMNHRYEIILQSKVWP